MAQPLNTELQNRGWKRKITRILLIAGPWLVLALVWRQGILIAPPHTGYTLVLWGLLLFVGPFLLVITGLRKEGWLRALSFKGCFYALILGVIALVVLLALIGPGIGSVMQISSVDCPSESLAEGQVRYVCTVYYFTGGYVYTLEGSAGSPFVREVNFKILND